MKMFVSYCFFNVRNSVYQVTLLHYNLQLK